MANSGYNSEKHSMLPYVDKPYKALLDAISDKDGRSRKKTLENAIVLSAQEFGFNIDKYIKST